MYVSTPLAPYYAQPLDGRDTVVDKFPSTTFEIEEAGKCHALGLDTACVLHLMRVLEIGLQGLAKRLRLTYDQANWGTVIGKIEGEIKRIESSKRKPKNWKTNRQFFAEIGSEFRLFKDAWRNYAMHGRTRYDAATTIYVGVRSFMRHLATRFGE